MIFNARYLATILIFWLITLAISQCVTLDIHRPQHINSIAPGVVAKNVAATAASKPAAYTPLHAANTQAEANALHIHDE